VNVATRAPAQPITPLKGPVRGSDFPFALPATTQTDKNLAGFLSLLNGLLGPTGIAIPKLGSASPAKRAGATSPPGVGAGGEKAHQAGEKAGKAEEPPEGTGARIDHPLQDDLFQNGALGTTPAVAMEMGEIPSSGVPAEYRPAQFPARSPDAKAFTPSSQDVALHTVATGRTTLVATPSIIPFSSRTTPVDSQPAGIPFSSARDVAFGLRVTWQSSASASEPVSAHSGSDATLSTAFGPRNPNDIPKPADMQAGAAKGPANSKAAEPDYSKLPLQNKMQVAQQPLQGADRPANSIPLMAPPALGGSTTTDSSMRERADFRPVETSAALGGWNARASSPPQNGMPVTSRGALTATSSVAPSAKAISSKSSSLEPILTPVEIDPEPPRPASASVAEIADPVFHPLASGHGVNLSEAAPQTETSNALNASQHQEGFTEPSRLSHLTESSISSHLEGPAISPLTAPHQPGGTANDSQSTTRQAGGDADSDEPTIKVQLPHKDPQIQNSQELSGLTTDRDLPGPSAAPNAPGPTAPRVSAPQTPQAPAALTEIEPPRATQFHPIREMSLRLTSPTNQVDVQLSARFGSLQVAVRTADPDLAKSLQGNLGELVGHLQEKGFRTDAWTPMDTQRSGLAFKDTSNKSDSEASGSQGGQPDSRGQQEPNQQQQERRKAQFEESLARATQKVNTWRRETR
jgi:hypothetical protein